MTRIYLTEEGVQVSGEGLDHLLEAVTEEPWNKHIPGDPMPCKCGDSTGWRSLELDETGRDKPGPNRES